MARISSYQKRKEEIKYLEQCISELEIIARGYARALKINTGKIPMILIDIGGDKFITEYQSWAIGGPLSPPD